VNYEVTIAIRENADLLKPDMTANVSIQTAQHDALLLPAGAVRHEGDQMFVYVAAKNGRERRAVAVGGKENGMIEIKKGLGPEDMVLVPANGGA
jgi:multidrug efflux pump subunit AcrA (membrane-fusion protein)